MLTWLRPIVSQSRSYVLACYSVKKPLRGNIAAKVKSDFKRKVSWDVFFLRLRRIMVLAKEMVWG